MSPIPPTLSTSGRVRYPKLIIAHLLCLERRPAAGQQLSHQSAAKRASREVLTPDSQQGHVDCIWIVASGPGPLAMEVFDKDLVEKMHLQFLPSSHVFSSHAYPIALLCDRAWVVRQCSFLPPQLSILPYSCGVPMLPLQCLK